MEHDSFDDSCAREDPRDVDADADADADEERDMRRSSDTHTRRQTHTHSERDTHRERERKKRATTKEWRKIVLTKQKHKHANFYLIGEKKGI